MYACSKYKNTKMWGSKSFVVVVVILASTFLECYVFAEQDFPQYKEKRK